MKKFTFLLAAMLAAAVSQAQRPVIYPSCNYGAQSVSIDINGYAQLSVDSFSQSSASATTPEVITNYFFLLNNGTSSTVWDYNCKDTNTITLVAVGSAGNRDTCYTNATTVSVRDTFAPTVRCRNITVTLSSATQNVTVAAFDLDNGSTDNCNMTYRIIGPNNTNLFNKTYTTAGTYSETLRVNDIGNNPRTCAATVTVLAAPVAVTVYEAAQTVRIMPNPFDGVVRVELATAISENQSISLYSLDGRLVQQAEIPANTNIFELNTVELPTGVYVLQLRNSAFQLSERIIKH